MRAAILALAALALAGCSCINPEECTVVYPKLGNHYGHTYAGIEVKGAVR